MSPVSKNAKRLAVAVIASLLAHVVIAGLVVFRHLLAPDALEQPDLDDLELGFVDAVEVEGATMIEEVPAAPAVTPATPAAEEDEEDEEEPTAVADASAVEDAGVDAAEEDAALDAGLDDAAIADASTDADAELDAADADAAPEDAGPDAGLFASAATGDAGTGASTRTALGARRIPPGAMLKLTFDLARVRGGFYERPVRDLLAAIGEWDLLLEGAGVVPMRDFDRLALITANPNDLGKISIVGRHRHDPNWVRARAQQIANARGQTLEWTESEGVLRAPWFARDGRERVVAILGNTHFAVCREADLPMLVRLVAHRARGPGVGTVLPNEFLSMAENEVLAFQVENLTRYVPGAVAAFGPIPSTARISVVLDPSRVTVDGLASFEDATIARTGADSWARIARNLALMSDDDMPAEFAGMQRLLATLGFTSEESDVVVDTRMDEAQARVLLGKLRDMFAQRRARQNLPPAHFDP